MSEHRGAQRARSALPAVDARPRVSGAWSLSIAAALLIGCLLFAAFLPRSTTLGARVQWSDRVAVFGLGVLVSALVGAPAWPRVRADRAGVRTRGFIGGYRFVPWSAVSAVTFPRGRHWASLELIDGDALPLYAVQRADGERSIAAMAGLRELHSAAKAAGPAPGADEGAQPPGDDPR